jgi:hypothetical protein
LLLSCIRLRQEPGPIVSVDPDLNGFEVIFTHDGNRLTSVVFDGSRFLLGSMQGGSIGVLAANAARSGAAADEPQARKLNSRGLAR